MGKLIINGHFLNLWGLWGSLVSLYPPRSIPIAPPKDLKWEKQQWSKSQIWSNEYIPEIEIGIRDQMTLELSLVDVR